MIAGKRYLSSRSEKRHASATSAERASHAGRSAKRRAISLARLQVRLGVRRKAPAGLVERDPLANAVKDVEHGLVPAARVENAVGRAHGYGERPRHRLGTREPRAVLAVEMPPREHREPLAESLGQRRCVVHSVGRTEAPQPARQGTDAVDREAGELIARDLTLELARLTLGVARVALGEDAAEVPVSLDRGDVEPDSPRLGPVDRHLASDHETHAGFFRGLERPDHPVQAIAVGHTQRVVSELRGAAEEDLRRRSAPEEREVRPRGELDEGHGSSEATIRPSRESANAPAPPALRRRRA